MKHTFHFGVVIPHFNRPCELKRAIDSIYTQSLLPSYIQIVDDNSSIAAYKRISYDISKMPISCPISLHRNNHNLGPSISRNIGFDLLPTHIDIICFLDSDDLWHFDKLRSISKIFQTYSQAHLVYHDFSSSSIHLGSYTGPVLKPSMIKCLLSNPLQTSCLSVRRSSFHYFDINCRFSEDYNYLLQSFHRNHNIYHIPATYTLLGRPENSSGGLSSNRRMMRYCELKSYLKFLNHPIYIFLFPLVFLIFLFKVLKEFSSLFICKIHVSQSS